MNSLINILLFNSLSVPNKIAFVNIAANNSVTNFVLAEKVKRCGSNLLNLCTSETVYLLFDESIDFITAFLACQYAGKIAVPLFFPKNKKEFHRLQIIIEDSQSGEGAFILCVEKNLTKVSKGIAEYSSDFSIETIENLNSETVLLSAIVNPISFIQYTSGSTGRPKGVVVSQTNILHNQKLIQKTFNCSSTSVILTWLPFYHDMGLIGNLLHSIYAGATCYMMNSAEVIREPLSWLRNIQKYKATHSGGPNFIYDLCVKQINENELDGIDLSNWEIAYNGSEPINAFTIKNFLEKFSKCNFRTTSFKTCYGLAESTLIVSGGTPVISGSFVSSGKVCDETELIFYTESTGLFNRESGELCIRGNSVTEGYRNKDNSTCFVTYKGKKYLSTGDIANLVDGELFVTGRKKEMFILNGKNYFPYDMEKLLSSHLFDLEENGVVVTSFPDNQDSLLVVAEVRRTSLNTDLTNLIRQIDQLILRETSLETSDILLVGPRQLPRTTSGKLQRVLVKELYHAQKIESVLQKKITNTTSAEDLLQLAQQLKTLPVNGDMLKEYLLTLLKQRLMLSEKEIGNLNDYSLHELGLSSIKGVEIVHEINKNLDIQLDVNQFFELSHFEKVNDYLLNLLWLKNNKIEGEEITI